MRLDVRDLVAGSGRDRLQRADLVSDQVLDLRGLHAREGPASEAVQVTVAWMRSDGNAARLRKLDGMAHDVGITGMISASNVDGACKLDHCGIIAHLPGTKAFAEIAVQIDGGHWRFRFVE